jgi:hypothetical protein
VTRITRPGCLVDHVLRMRCAAERRLGERARKFNFLPLSETGEKLDREINSWHLSLGRSDDLGLSMQKPLGRPQSGGARCRLLTYT